MERYGSGIFLGSGIDERFGFSVEVRYADKNMAESYNCIPTTGRLPEKENEAAVSSIILEALGVPQKLGEEVTLTWEVNPTQKQYKTDTFRICGIWQGDKAVLGQMVWVSEAYAKKNSYSVTQEELENGIYNGSKDYSVWYKNLWNLEKKTENISKAAGFTKAGTGLEANPAYNLFDKDSFSFSSLIVMILFVILAGYLIIYNIFSISVKTDIRAYGLLKNVGTTGKQLKKIVHMQAWRLSVVGIPIGLLCGYLAGLCMAPSLTADAEISEQAGQTAQTVVSANPLIFFAAALLTLITVYLSSLQACKMVENVLKVNDMINVSSVLDMKASFQRFVSKYYMIGGFLVVILAFIGIMNFFNTTATSVISRKKELALLEVVGMTKKQISKMLVTEGFIYLGGAFVIAIVLIVFGAEKILANTFAKAFFFQMHLTIVPCLLMLPILTGIAYMIPKYQFEKMSRESVVERIRKE